MPPRAVEVGVSDLPRTSKTSAFDHRFSSGSLALLSAVRKTSNTLPDVQISNSLNRPHLRAGYIVEPVGYTIREHKIRSRIHLTESSDGSSEDEPAHTNTTHSKYAMYELRITAPDRTCKTIFRRYHDFEELNEVLPSSISHMARLPGRRYWARLMGSRFTSKAIEDRQCEVVGYLQRVLELAPEFQAVQMFICDDWLSRDTPQRRRQLSRVVRHMSRLERLVAARLRRSQETSERLETELESNGRQYHPSPLGPHYQPDVSDKDQDLVQRGRQASDARADSRAQSPPASPLLGHPPSDKIFAFATHPRVRDIRDCEAWEPVPVVPALAESDAPRSSRPNFLGTPAQRKWTTFPRAPLPADATK